MKCFARTPFLLPNSCERQYGKRPRLLTALLHTPTVNFCRFTE